MSSEVPHFVFYHGEPILPPSVKRESITIEELQEKYPFRYKLYSQGEDGKEPINGLQPEVIIRRLQMLNNLDRYITTQGRPGRGRVLREKQLAVFRDTRDFLETGETEGYVEAPTGFGKTVLFSEFIKATDQRTLVVVPSRILVEQTYQRLRQFNPTLDIGRYYSDIKERDRQVIVTTYHSLVKSCGGIRPKDIDLLILDEVHQSLTDARIETVGRFVHPVKLGFTATPEYSKDKRVENLLNNQIHTVSLREAVETGLLCSFSVFLAETDVDLSNVSVDQDGDYNDRELEEAINIYSRNKSAVELYQRLNKEYQGLKKAVTYCVSIRHAQEVARLFNEAGIPSAAVWSDQDRDERHRVLEAYARGDIKVLTNVNVLTEGFDDPQAALCLNLRPTLSNVVAKQRGGRVLRLDHDNPRKYAIIVDYLDRNENKRTTQVTFAHVAEGAQIINPFTIDVEGTDTDGNGNGNGDKVLIDKEPIDLTGIHIITNSQEVLRIVRESLKGESLSPLSEEDFAVHARTLLDLFYGSPASLLPKSKQIMEESPSMWIKKTSGSAVVDVVIDKEWFIQEMQRKGAILSSSLRDEITERDFPITQKNLSIFSGNHEKIRKFAEQALLILSASRPESVYRAHGGTAIIDVVTDKQAFIEIMVKLGSTLKEDLPDRVGPGELVISHPTLYDLFKGSTPKLMAMAKEVVESIRQKNPDLISEKMRMGQKVNTVLDRKRFIEEMLSRGAKLKPKQAD